MVPVWVEDKGENECHYLLAVHNHLLLQLLRCRQHPHNPQRKRVCIVVFWPPLVLLCLRPQPSPDEDVYERIHSHRLQLGSVLPIVVQ